MAERFKAPVLLAEAGRRSEHRRSRWPEGRGTGRPESNCRGACGARLLQVEGEMAEWFKAAVLLAEAGRRSEHRRSRWPEGRGTGCPESNCRGACGARLLQVEGEMAEWFKAAVLLAEAGRRSEHRRSRWPEGRGTGCPESNCRGACGARLLQVEGEMAEWFKAAVLKTAVGLRPPWVRIPLSPPIPYINQLLICGMKAVPTIDPTMSQALASMPSFSEISQPACWRVIAQCVRTRRLLVNPAL